MTFSHDVADIASTEVSLTDKVSALQNSSIYPHAAGMLRCIETHFAWIFLAGEFAYKLKKPIRQDRMNHVSIAARRHSCHAELELNRRLAPSVYLDVVPLLAGPGGSLFLHGDGEPVDWLVKMRRLDNEQFLDRRLQSNNLTLAAVHAAGRMLTDFYQCRQSEPISGQSYLRRLRTQINVNCRELLKPELMLNAMLVNDIAARQLAFIEQHTQLGARADQGRIVEGHGDLRPEHIYLGTPTCIIDCLEFDRDLRLYDPLEEMAFLFMECELLDATWVGREIIEIYALQIDETVSESLLNFYCSHRATTRAKIVAWHLRDSFYRHRADWQTLATRYLTLARAHLS